MSAPAGSGGVEGPETPQLLSVASGPAGAVPAVCVGEGQHGRDSLITGPACRHCGRTEQRCAWLRGECCLACTHWDGYDAAGHPFTPKPKGREREHGTQKGFDQHRYRAEPPCRRCMAAHSAYVMARRRAS